MRPSNLALYGTLVALVFLGLAAVIYVAPGPESTQRLGLLFGILATAVMAIVAAIRSDQSAQQTNGALDDRIKGAVQRALDARRAGDPPPPDPSA